MSSRYLISVAIGLILAWMIWPSRKAIGGQRWGRSLAAFGVFVPTVSQLWRIDSPMPDGGINALATWAIQAISLGVGAFVVGVISYSLVTGAKKVSRNAFLVVKSPAKTGLDFIKETTFEGHKKCPFCAETIKKSAIFCRFCQHDLSSDLMLDPVKSIGLSTDHQSMENPSLDKLQKESTADRQSAFALFALALFGVAAGVGWLYVEHREDSELASEIATKPNLQAQMQEASSPVYVAFDPFTVKLLKENGDQVLQLAITVEAENMRIVEKLKMYTPNLRNSVMLLLAAKKASDLDLIGGKERLANEIRELMNDVMNTGDKGTEGPVREVLFTSFVIQ